MIELLPAVRNDRAGGGRFGDPRGERLHEGTDVRALAGQPVALKRPMHFNRIGMCYGGDDHYKLVEMRLAEYSDILVQFFYVDPRKGMKVHDLYQPGFVIGYVQDIAGRYPDSGMQNHIHVEVIRNGKNVDPEHWIRTL